MSARPGGLSLCGCKLPPSGCRCMGISRWNCVFFVRRLSCGWWAFRHYVIKDLKPGEGVGERVTGSTIVFSFHCYLFHLSTYAIAWQLSTLYGLAWGGPVLHFFFCFYIFSRIVAMVCSLLQYCKGNEKLNKAKNSAFMVRRMQQSGKWLHTERIGCWGFSRCWKEGLGPGWLIMKVGFDSWFSLGILRNKYFHIFLGTEFHCMHILVTQYTNAQ